MILPLFQSRSSFTIAYEPATLCGEAGFTYAVYRAARLVYEGWSRGGRKEAEREAKRWIGRAG